MGFRFAALSAFSLASDSISRSRESRPPSERAALDLRSAVRVRGQRLAYPGPESATPPRARRRSIKALSLQRLGRGPDGS